MITPRWSKVRSALLVVGFLILGARDGHALDPKCTGGASFFSADDLLARTYNNPQSPPIIAAETVNPAAGSSRPLDGMGERALADSHVTVTLKRQGLSVADWSAARVYGAAQTERKHEVRGKGFVPVATQPIGVLIKERTDDAMVLSVLVPVNPGALSYEKWLIVPILCADDNRILGYATVSIVSVSGSLAWTIAILATIAFWAAITFATWKLNANRLQKLWLETQGTSPSAVNPVLRRRLWKLAEAANPVFISQDSLGYGSLSRFQILIFTTTVGFVLLYIFIHSGVLSSMSSTILLLLGITVAGGTFARAANDWQGISVASRQFLLGSNILKVRRDEKPRFSDLLETQGEVDVSKVQALLFTMLVAISIVSSSITGLGDFELPEQIVYLTGISQGAYVLGKILPTGTRTRLEQDLAQLRTAAASLRADPADEQRRSLFAQAKQAAASTLSETYLDRFNPGAFEGATNDPLRI